ncbi:MAG TPA: hypothetical protein VIR45_03995 [Kiloniellaceae bacterium]
MPALKALLMARIAAAAAGKSIVGEDIRFQASRHCQVHLAVNGAINAEGDTSLYFRIGETF